MTSRRIEADQEEAGPPVRQAGKIAESRFAQARESIEEAELFYREHMGNKAVMAKLYHAMMYCLFALSGIRDIGNLTHGDVIERFEKKYVLTGVFDANLLAAIRGAYDLTHECDCDHMPVPTDEDIERTMHAAKEFMTAAERYLQLR